MSSRWTATTWAAICRAFDEAKTVKDQPVALIANTIKGKGAPFIADNHGWHGKALPEADLKKALEELGPVNTELRGGVRKPAPMRTRPRPSSSPPRRTTNSARWSPPAARTAMA